jgi:hypothetical protein
MSLKTLEFENEEDYRIARDIRLDILEREGRLAKPDLSMIFADDDLWAETKEKIDASGVPYRLRNGV